MAVTGQRFHVDLSSDDEDVAVGNRWEPSSAAALDFGFVSDVKEHSPSSSTTPPSAPQLRNTTTGFPPHRRRSKFAQRRSNEITSTDKLHGRNLLQTREVAAAGKVSTGRDDQVSLGKPLAEVEASSEDTERKRIDEGNRKIVAQMLPDEIAREQQELLAGLSPSLIERLLRKANVDDGRTDIGTVFSSLDADEPAEPIKKKSSAKKVTFASSPDEDGLEEVPPASPHRVTSNPDNAPSIPPADLQPASSLASLLPAPRIHFPHPPQPPSLDPSDPDFVSSLHSKYFPSFPNDPSKLAWMAPIPTPNSTADLSSPYHPSQPSLAASSIRFSFRGDLLPPNLSRQLPSNAGLHHHSDAPEAAGYTVPELAHLSRSAFPAQRCVAYQTLGRILYRLGIGVFGDEEEELARGLWKCIEEGRVLDTLVTQAGRGEGEGNRSCRITAVEAVWLWRKGGGKRMKAV